MSDETDRQDLEDRVEQLESTISKMLPSRRDALKLGGAALVGGAAMSGSASAGTQQAGTIGTANDPVDVESEDINNADTVTTEDLVSTNATVEKLNEAYFVSQFQDLDAAINAVKSDSNAETVIIDQDTTWNDTTGLEVDLLGLSKNYTVDCGSNIDVLNGFTEFRNVAFTYDNTDSLFFMRGATIRDCRITNTNGSTSAFSMSIQTASRNIMLGCEVLMPNTTNASNSVAVSGTNEDALIDGNVIEHGILNNGTNTVVGDNLII